MADAVSLVAELRAFPQQATRAALARILSHFLVDDTELLTTTRAVLASENGKTFMLNSATSIVTTLPPIAKGLRYTFIVMTAPSGGNHTVVTLASANIIIGLQTPVDGTAGDFGTADDTISFVDSQAVAGDRCEVFCDGVKWYAYAVSKVAAGITFTQAS